MAAPQAPAAAPPPPPASPAAMDGDDDAPAPSAKPPKAPRPPPALPWMRCPLPVGGGGVPLACVTGMDARIEAWLRDQGAGR